MLRSLFSGTSGLKTHQLRIDVIGNNIANVNTTGYKNSRANFRETILQTLGVPGAPSATRGSVNPRQVGLGATSASIDPDFTQGNLETTGRRSDVAIEGQGFFILGSGERRFYTRNGAFNVDQQGNLVALTNGFYVMGWNADREGAVDSTVPIQSINIPIGGLTLARATTRVSYLGNLDATQPGFAQTAETEGRITTNPFLAGAQTFTVTPDDATVLPDTVTVPQIVAGGAYTSDARRLDYTVLNNVLATDRIQITRTTNGGPAVSDVWTPIPGNYSNVSNYVDQFVADWNTGANWAGLTPLVWAVKEGPTSVRFFDYSVAANGGQGDASSFAFAPDPAVGTTSTAATIQALGMRSGVYETFGASATPDPEYLALVLACSANSGLGAVPDPTTLATLTTDGSGRAIFTSTLPGLNGRLTLSDDPTFTAINTIYGLPSTRVDIDTYRTSVVVYDTLGVQHTVNLDFNRRGDTRVWEYSATDENGFNIIPGGTSTSGTLAFDNAGRSQTSGINVELNLTSGAQTPQQITLQVADLNQFEGSSTVAAGDQDGIAMGTLENFLISTDGTVNGEFTNGLNQTLARLATATFSNPGGLVDVGSTMWNKSVSSGEAQIGTPESASRGRTVQASLESSNVDLANEFTQLIIGQRGFQANARVITTSDEMLNELTNLRR